MIQRKRHIGKAISYRVLASFSTFLITFGVTGKIEYGLTIGTLDAAIKLFLYYAHERLWYKSKFGVLKGDKNE